MRLERVDAAGGKGAIHKTRTGDDSAGDLFAIAAETNSEPWTLSTPTELEKSFCQRSPAAVCLFVMEENKKDDRSENFRPVPLCGLPAVLGCFERRPAAIKKLLFGEEHFGALAAVRSWLAERRLPFVHATDTELARAAGNSAHGGVVALTERPLPAFPRPSDFDTWRTAGEHLVLLEDVADPLQIGAVARVAAAFGIKRLLLGGRSAEAVFFGRAWSAAAGALDMLTLHDAGETPVLLRSLRDKFCIVGFTRPGGRRAQDVKPMRAPGRPLLIAFGDTETGVTPETGGKCEHLVHIPGANGSTLLNAGDAAAYGLPWLLTRERKTAGFLTAKRAASSAAKSAPPATPSK
jgi:TrmH RNA methyltransferase